MAFEITEAEPAWGRDDRFWRPDLPLVWLTLGLAAFGVLILESRVLPAFSAQLPATSLAAVAWVLYVLPFVFVVVRLDLHEPEPPAFLASAFGWGALVATPVAIVANLAGQGILAEWWGTAFSTEWSSALLAPVTEEVMKTLGVVVVVFVARRQLTTVLDGMIYGAFVGLGMQITENFVYTTNGLRSPWAPDPGAVVGDMLIGRGLEIGLWSHTVYSALAGFGIAYAVVATGRRVARRAAVAVAAFLLAGGLHALWNAPFTQVSEAASFSEELTLYAAKGLPALALVLMLAALARGREVRWFARALRDEDPAIVSAEERDVLRTTTARREAVAAVRRTRGRAAGRALRQLQSAQVELAVRKATGADDKELEAARDAVRAARNTLVTAQGAR